MPLEDFYSHTFVAFTDIEGFTQMMREGDGRRAVQALDDFYSVGYSVAREQSQNAIHVDCLFVSDCGILFVRGEAQPIEERLEALLTAIETIHRRCSERAVFLTSSIAWGLFSYHQRIEIPGIEKNPIFGNAYIHAFADNESGTPKIFSGECRIVREGLPPVAEQFCDTRQGGYASRLRGTSKHYYFEWTRPKPNLDLQ
jgi:hypothetical protein